MHGPYLTLRNGARENAIRKLRLIEAPRSTGQLS